MLVYCSQWWPRHTGLACPPIDVFHSHRWCRQLRGQLKHRPMIMTTGIIQGEHTGGPFFMTVLSLKLKVSLCSFLKKSLSTLLNAGCLQGVFEKAIMVCFLSYTVNFQVFTWLKVAWEQIFPLSVWHTRGSTQKLWRGMEMANTEVGMKCFIVVDFKSILFSLLTKYEFVQCSIHL